MNTLFTNPDNNPPHKKHNNTSCKGIVKFPEFNIKDTTAIMIPDIKSVGIISIFLNFLITMVNDEKQKAQPIAIIFPNKSPVLIRGWIKEISEFLETFSQSMHQKRIITYYHNYPNETYIKEIKENQNEEIEY